MQQKVQEGLVHCRYSSFALEKQLVADWSRKMLNDFLVVIFFFSCRSRRIPWEILFMSEVSLGTVSDFLLLQLSISPKKHVTEYYNRFFKIIVKHRISTQKKINIVLTLYFPRHVSLYTRCLFRGIKLHEIYTTSAGKMRTFHQPSHVQTLFT